MNFRLVTLDDAEFIWDLRNDEYKSRHLHEVGPTVDDQREWLKDYKDKESRGEEFYFLISDGGNTPQGLFRIYEIQPDSATVGSWIFKEDAPNFMAIRAELMLKEFAFNNLNKSTLYFDTRKKNKRVYSYSKMHNCKVIDEDNENYYFKLDKEDFKEGKEKVKKMMQIQC